MDSKIGFEMSLIVVEAIHGRCASFMTNGNGFGDIWWTDKFIYFSSTDVSKLLNQFYTSIFCCTYNHELLLVKSCY